MINMSLYDMRGQVKKRDNKTFHIWSFSPFSDIVHYLTSGNFSKQCNENKGAGSIVHLLEASATLSDDWDHVLESDFNQQSRITAQLNIKVTFNSSCKCISQDDKAVKGRDIFFVKNKKKKENMCSIDFSLNMIVRLWPNGSLLGCKSREWASFCLVLKHVHICPRCCQRDLHLCGLRLLTLSGWSFWWMSTSRQSCCTTESPLFISSGLFAHVLF